MGEEASTEPTTTGVHALRERAKIKIKMRACSRHRAKEVVPPGIENIEIVGVLAKQAEWDRN